MWLMVLPWELLMGMLMGVVQNNKQYAA